MKSLYVLEMTALAVVCVLLTESAPLTRPPRARQLSDADGANSGWLEQTSLLYHNAHDERILLGEFELLRLMRTVNVGHPLMLPWCTLTAIVVKALQNGVSQPLQELMLRRWKRPAEGPFVKGMHPQDMIDGPYIPNRRARVKLCLFVATLWNLFATCVPWSLLPLAALVGGIWHRNPEVCISSPTGIGQFVVFRGSHMLCTPLGMELSSHWEGLQT